MADKKISALTGAATPLAGTEVLPIVQSGATVKVAVSDLTAGRSVSATSIAADLGLVATPTYTFAGDLNTGMWSPAADTIAFSEGGVEAMRINSSGNVGIGTSVPTTGSMSNLATLNAGIFITHRGSVSATTAVATTIAVAAGDNNVTYIVSCCLFAADPVNYNAVAIVSGDAGTFRVTALQTAVLVAISVSGANIQATQTSGGTQPIQFCITRVS